MKEMIINDHTKISELIALNKSAIDAIAAVAKPLRRLKNPVLRKVMASRVNISEAAKMADCNVKDIVAALIPLGFSYEITSSAKETTIQPKPFWLRNAKESDIIWYDVRPIIESGTDPLKNILGKFKEVPHGKVLCIINSFIPTPLIHLLKQEKAEDSYVQAKSHTEFYTYFLKKQREDVVNKAAGNAGDKVIMDDADSFQSVYNAFSKEKIKEIDVRRLEMPLPMQTILKELDELPKGNMLFVHHKRVPVYLLEDLANKNYEVHIHTIDEKNVKMILFETSSV